MQCAKCASPLPDGATFCGICGEPVQFAGAPMQPPPMQQQPMYQGGYQQPGYQDTHNEPLTVGSYLLMFLVMALPFINLIMLFVWAFGDSNLNRKNFAKAGLIMIVISIVLSFVFAALMGTVMMQFIDSSNMMY